jgi:hypothetical protein
MIIVTAFKKWKNAEHYFFLERRERGASPKIGGRERGNPKI